MERLRMISAVLVLINHCPMFGQSSDRKPKPEEAIAQGLPDLRGLWGGFGPRNSNTPIARFNISQSGDSFSISRLDGGKPPVLVFEGAFKSDRLISGNAIDAGPTAGWHPAEMSVVDMNRLKLDANLFLARIAPKEAAIFNEQRRLSFQKLPEQPFDLRGTWRTERGSDVLSRQSGSEISLVMVDEQKPFFKGQYTSNPEIVGLGWENGATTEHQNWIERRIVVGDLDHINYGGNPLYRVSEPPAVGCDARNTYHVTGYFARLRGLQAAVAKDYKTAKCWFTIGATWQVPAAQSLLADLIIDGKDGSQPDYALAFDLASKSAAAGDPAGAFTLATLYREGKGAPRDAEKAEFWLDTAKRTEQMRAMMTPENMLNSLNIVGGIVGGSGLLDFNMSMTPHSCYTTEVLGNRPKADCVR